MDRAVFRDNAKPGRLVNIFYEGNLVNVVRIRCKLMFCGGVVRIVIALSKPVVFRDSSSFMFRAMFLVLITAIEFSVEGVQVSSNFSKIKPCIRLCVVVILIYPVFGKRCSGVVSTRYNYVYATIPVRLYDEMRELVISTVRTIVR